MDEIKAKQQVVEKIKESAKILVTVSDSPSVDALSAALALTLLLDKKEKYASAIFSGETPPAIAFLEPEKTFDDTTDSLRDFIIALNKEKADHLRYKVEGDSVKIFITPYKTTITQNDLEFSQGDYNVELVIALGVDNQDHLDKALEEHGKILHDATIITLTAGDQASDLGGIDWHDASASSLSEMITGLAEAMKDDKKKPLLDASIATALLTGIVAETDRFSNQHTTSRAMTVAASLMAAGADQQLIVTELQALHDSTSEATQQEAPKADDVVVDETSDDGSLTITKHDASALDIEHEEAEAPAPEPQPETLADLDRRVLGEEKAEEKVSEEIEAVQEEPAHETLEPLSTLVEAAPQVIQSTPNIRLNTEDVAPIDSNSTPEDTVEPTLGGTLNATAEQAAEDARREAESDQNKTILSHAYLGTDNPGDQNLAGFPGTPSVAPGSVGVNEVASDESVHSSYAAENEDIPNGEPAVTSQQEGPVGGSVAAEKVIQPLSDAYTAAPTPEPFSVPVVEPTSAYAAEPVPTPPPAPAPADLGLPLPPPLPDFSQMNGAAPALPVPPPVPEQQPGILGDIFAPEPTSAYAPEASTEPTMPPIDIPAPAPLPEVQPPASNDPGQFQIPPQQ